MPRRPAPIALALLVWGAALLAACSAPPQKERDQADGALAAARAAEAATYAPAELEEAVKALQAYDASVAQGDYRLALSHAIGARDSAYAAAKLAGDRKAAARGEAERLIVDLEGLVLIARSRLAGTPPPLAAAAATRTRAALRRAPSLLQEARSLLDRQDFKGVGTLLRPVVQSLRKDLTPRGK
jgi:hypothetical protein